MNKIFIAACIFILLPVLVNAQNNAATQQQVDSAVEKITGEQYVRIPNKDFDTLLENKIDEKVSSKVFFWVGLLVGTISFILVLLNYYVVNKQKEQIQEYVKKELSETQKELQKQMQHEFQKYFEAVDKRLNDLMSIFSLVWRECAYNLIDRTKNNKNIITAEEAESFNALLDNKTFILKDESVARVIDSYVRCIYYSTRAFTDHERFSKMHELITVYGQKIKLLPETYASAAIAFQDRYEQFNQAEDRIKCIECCEESIKKQPDYGTSYAVKIEVYMIDFLRAFDPAEQNTAKGNVLRMLKIIENSSSTYLLPELTDRLKNDRKGFLKKYIDELENQFKPELTKLNIVL